MEIPDTIKTTISESNAFIFNLEGPILESTFGLEGPYNSKYISAALSVIGKRQPIVISDSWILDVLDLCKNNIACLANNHILDGGLEGLKNTIDLLESNNFYYLGAGEYKKKAAAPLKLEISDIDVTITNYNFIGWEIFSKFINVFGATDTDPGANYDPPSLIQSELKSLKKSCDILISVFHMGSELSKTIKNERKNFLRSLESDVNIIHHPHVVAETEVKNTYACGDFIFKNSALPAPRDSKVYFIDLDDSGNIVRKESRDILITNGNPNYPDDD